MSISKQAKLMVNYILTKIVNQEWKQDQHIHSEGFFQIKFDLSNAVVRKTLVKLQKINLIYAKERVGYFVQKNNLQLLFKRETYSDGCNGSDYHFGNFSTYYKLTDLKTIPFTNTNINSIKLPHKSYMFNKNYYNNSSGQKIIKKVSYAINNNHYLPQKHFDFNKPLFLNMILANGLPSKRYSFARYESKIPIDVRQILAIPKSFGAIVKYVVLVSPSNEIIHSSRIWINPLQFSSEHIANL